MIDIYDFLTLKIVEIIEKILRVYTTSILK